MSEPSFDMRIFPPDDMPVVLLVSVDAGMVAWVDSKTGESSGEGFALQLTHEAVGSDEQVKMDYMMPPGAAAAMCGVILTELGRQGKLDTSTGLRLMATIAGAST